MPNQTPDIIAAIDIGSSTTRVMVGESSPEGGLIFTGYGFAETKGVRKSLISDIKAVAESIKHATEQAEKMAGCDIERAVVAIGGSHIRGLNSSGGIALGNRHRDITRDDVKTASDRARSVQLPPDRTVIHLLPQQFVVDDQLGIQEPLGMTAMKLQVHLHLVTASESVRQSVNTAVNKAGVAVDDIVFDGVASAECLSELGDSERTLGCVVIDIGAGSTEIAAFYDGALVHTAAVPIGGEHFAGDAAIGLKTTMEIAEQMIARYGCAVVVNVRSENDIEVPVPGSGPKIVSQRYLAEILEARATELFKHVKESLRAGGVLDYLGAGAFLTGGSSRLPMIDEICEQALRCRVRVDAPLPIAKMPHALVAPEMSTIVGLLAYAHRTRFVNRGADEKGITAKLRQLFAGA